MNVQQLFDELDACVAMEDQTPIMIWGVPGVGKTAAVRQVATKHDMAVIDVRWGQMTPADLRLPVPNHEEKVMTFYPPEWFPRDGRYPGKVALFLDEFNQAASVMQGIGQQLIHDRCIGNVRLAGQVWVWAAGNRKEDKAAVYDMPTPTANRFYHFTIEPELDALMYWWYANNKDPRIMGFLKWRPNLIHNMPADTSVHAWPSPRSWEMAERRLRTKRQIGPAVGDAVESEFEAYMRVINDLPDLENIAKGGGKNTKFPEEPSLRFAIISGLTEWCLKDFEMFKASFTWMDTAGKDDPEWTSMLVLDVLRILGRNDAKKNQQYMAGLMKMPQAKQFINRYIELTTGRAA